MATQKADLNLLGEKLGSVSTAFVSYQSQVYAVGTFVYRTRVVWDVSETPTEANVSSFAHCIRFGRNPVGGTGNIDKNVEDNYTINAKDCETVYLNTWKRLSA